MPICISLLHLGQEDIVQWMSSFKRQMMMAVENTGNVKDTLRSEAVKRIVREDPHSTNAKGTRLGCGSTDGLDESFRKNTYRGTMVT